MYRFVSWCLLTLALPTFAWAGPLEDGKAALEDDDYRTAIARFQEAVRVAPNPADKAEASDYLGVAHCLERQYWSGLKSILTSLELAPERRLVAEDYRHLGTNRMARCARQTALLGQDAAALEGALVEALHLSKGADLDVELKKAINQDGFVCPELPKVEKVVSTPPPPPAETRNEPAAATLATPAPVEPAPRLRTYAYATGAVSIASLAAAAGLGLAAKNKASNAEVDTWDEDIDSAKDMALGANILWGVGGGAALATVLLWVFDEDPSADREATVVLPTANGVRVQF